MYCVRYGIGHGSGRTLPWYVWFSFSWAGLGSYIGVGYGHFKRWFGWIKKRSQKMKKKKQKKGQTLTSLNHSHFLCIFCLLHIITYLCHISYPFFARDFHDIVHILDKLCCFDFLYFFFSLLLDACTLFFLLYFIFSTQPTQVKQKPGLKKVSQRQAHRISCTAAHFRNRKSIT